MCGGVGGGERDRCVWRGREEKGCRYVWRGRGGERDRCVWRVRGREGVGVCVEG